REGTVMNHASSILPMLGVRDRTLAVLTAIERGLLLAARSRRILAACTAGSSRHDASESPKNVADWIA
ncbi:MAG: hypothetical protein QOI66_4079, partial [Myxococcales bacterium]|nr:hypothetical protein [Myxococcales bacterium]